jgi:hypothetical protein
MFSPQNVQNLCVSYSSQIATVPLNISNRLIFVAETLCVSCEARTEILYII